MNVSVIICAYNEEKTIANVVESCCKHCQNSEIIVVDDGSTDNTASILNALSKRLSFKYERLVENKGKSWAMAHGVEKATGEIILFFDADVSNIKGEHFYKLLAPIFAGEADMVLGQPSETLIDYRINPFKSLTGERALFKKDIVPLINDIRDVRFGVETFLNLYYQSVGKKIEYVLLNELIHPTKYEKTSTINATKEFVNEGQEIFLTLLWNYKLIIKRVELLITNTNSKAVKEINEVQIAINKNLTSIKNKITL
ncbi:MAG: glycosyltransferase family 2 protein [Bacteroidales bacterium]